MSFYTTKDVQSEVSMQCNTLLNVKIAELGWLLLVNCILFESYLSNIIAVASYLDEIITVLLLLFALIQTTKQHALGIRFLSHYESLGIIALLILIGVGLIGGSFSEIQQNYQPIIIDVFTCSKFCIALLSGYFVFQNKENLYRLILNESKLLLLAMIPFAIINQFIDLGMRFDFRYGLYSFQFIFGHPASLSAVVVGFFVLILADEQNNNFGWLLLCWFFLIATLRSTAIAFSAWSFLITLFSKRKKRIGFSQILTFAPVVVLFGWSQIQYYFIDVSGSARRTLLKAGIRIANDYFPLGSGFATYASNITSQAEYYSPLYYRYGLSDIYGLMLGDSSFLSDSFWPIVIGQFGWLGAAIFILLVCCLVLGCHERLSANGCSSLALFMGISYLLIASFSSSAFFHPFGPFIAVCMSIGVCHQLYFGIV